LYAKTVPSLPLGLPFMPAQAAADYLSWPKLPELLPASVSRREDQPQRISGGH